MLRLPTNHRKGKMLMDKRQPCCRKRPEEQPENSDPITGCPEHPERGQHRPGVFSPSSSVAKLSRWPRALKKRVGSASKHITVTSFSFTSLETAENPKTFNQNTRRTPDRFPGFTRAWSTGPGRDSCGVGLGGPLFHVPTTSFHLVPPVLRYPNVPPSPPSAMHRRPCPRRARRSPEPGGRSDVPRGNGRRR